MATLATVSWFRLVGAGAVGALMTACTALSGLDGLAVVDLGASDDAAPIAPDAHVAGDAGSGFDSASTGDSASRPDSAADSSTEQDATSVDSTAPPADAQPVNASCVPLGVDPCQGSHENCVPDPNLPSPDPLNPPSACFVIQGAGLGEGEVCTGSAQCAQGLDCIGTQGGTYTCQWMCYDAVESILFPPPFDAGVIGSQPGRGGCPSLEVCTSVVNGYPAWLSVCTGM